MAVEQWLAAKRACALQLQQQQQQGMQGLQAASAKPVPYSGLVGSSGASAGPEGLALRALDAAAGELARRTPLLVQLAFPAEHAAATTAPPFAEVALVEAGQQTVAPVGAGPTITTPTANTGVLKADGTGLHGLGWEPGSAVRPARVPAALSHRARAALGHAARAAGDAVLMAVCRCALGGRVPQSLPARVLCLWGLLVHPAQCPIRMLAHPHACTLLTVLLLAARVPRMSLCACLFSFVLNRTSAVDTCLHKLRKVRGCTHSDVSRVHLL